MSKTKDYHILKLRYFAERYLLDKWHNGDTHPKQHWDRAVNHNEFKDKLIEKLSGMSKRQWNNKYADTFRNEVINEYLEFEHGIYSGNFREGYWYLFIPKTKSDVFKWVKDNYKNRSNKSGQNYSSSYELVI